MHFLAPDPAAIVADPDWLAHRYDPVADHVHFVRADRAAHRAATFLTDEYLPQGDGIAVLPRSAAMAAMAASPPVAPRSFVFHSAYCCSTLLARAFDVVGVAMGLKEPVILNDLSGWLARGGEWARVEPVLGDALALLARPFVPGEHVVIKPSNVVNGLIPAMLAAAPEAKALLLHAPLPAFLASIARKGMWGRLWVRELFVKLAEAGLADYGFDTRALLQQTDLQLAALGWLAQHRLFAQLAVKFGGQRVRTLESERMLHDPAATMVALDRHFGIGIGAEAAAALGHGPAFGRHSKTGDRFDRRDRADTQASDLAAYGDEVAKVVVWAQRVAEAAGQPLDLPAPLFD